MSSNIFTKPLETSTRKKIDSWLLNLGWNIDEESPDCNVVTERGYTKEQKEKLAGNQPDYLLLKNGTSQPLAVIEAKTIGKSLDQALDDAIKKYAEPLQAPLVFATDGTFLKSWHMKEQKELTINGEQLKELISENVLLRFLGSPDIDAISAQVKHSREELIRIFDWANNLLRKEGLRGLDRFVEFANVLFLKLISEIEEDKEQTEERILDRKYCWDSFSKLPPDMMMEYLNGTVLPFLVEQYNRTGDVFQEEMQIKNPNTLKEIVDKLSELTLINTESEIKGDAFEYFLKSLTTGNDLGEYFTPRHIVKIMTKLINPQYGERIYDPCCGTGGFLIEAFRHIKRLCKLTPETVDKLKHDTVFGTELTNTARIAKMNMILAGDGHTNIHQGDSLEKPIKGKYDAVLTNFPFSQRTDYGHYYGLNTEDGNVVFLKHIVDALEDDGRAGVVSFQGVLYDNNTVYRDIRKYLLEHCAIEAVIKLHNYVFRPYSGANTSILVFTKGRPTRKVWFFNVENDGFKKTSSLRGRPPIKENDLNLLEEIWSIKEETSKSWLVDVKTIENNNFILDAEMYKPRAIPEFSTYEKTSITDVCHVITEPVRQFSGKRRYLKTGNLIESQIMDYDMVNYDDRPNRANIEVSENDVIFAKMKDTNKNLLISKDIQDIIVSTGFVVLQVKDMEKLLPQFLSYLVDSNEFLKWKDALAHGSTQKAINITDDLSKIEIPIPPINVQKFIIEELQIKKQKINQINALLRLYKSVVDDALFDFEHVETKKLEELLTAQPKNGIYKSRSFYGSGTPIIRIDNIYDGQLFVEDIKRVRLSDNEVRTYSLNINDIILNRVNSEEYIGKCCVYKEEFLECVFESNMMRFAVDTDSVLPEYVVYYLTSNYGRQQILTRIKKAVNQVSINQTDVKSVVIPVPTMPTQKEIVETVNQQVDTINNLKEIKERLKKEINKRISSLYH